MKLESGLTLGHFRWLDVHMSSLIILFLYDHLAYWHLISIRVSLMINWTWSRMWERPIAPSGERLEHKCYSIIYFLKFKGHFTNFMFNKYGVPVFFQPINLTGIKCALKRWAAHRLAGYFTVRHVNRTGKLYTCSNH